MIAVAHNEQSLDSDNNQFRPGDSEHARRGRKRYAIRQLLESKELLMRDIADQETTPSARAQLVRALVAADEQIMVRKGIPAPKPAEVQSRRSRSQAKIAPIPVQE